MIKYGRTQIDEYFENIENRLLKIENDLLRLAVRSPLPNEQWIEERLRALELQSRDARNDIDFLCSDYSIRNIIRNYIRKFLIWRKN